MQIFWKYLLYFCHRLMNYPIPSAVMNQSELSPKLEDLPNIGSTLADLLREAGINSPDELYSVGAIQAFIRIRAVDSDACLCKLCALEGAVEGIRWHTLPKDRKAELKYFFTKIKIQSIH
jgi:DNA transformation protein and related proteins